MKHLKLKEFFKPPVSFEKALQRLEKALDAGDEQKVKKYLEKAAGAVGITYMTKTKKIEGQEVEIPYTDFNSLQFVDFLHKSFVVISMAGNVAFYNYEAHEYDFVSEAVYLSFFKQILDMVDVHVWGQNREKEYAKRFLRCISLHLANWQIPEGKIVFTNGVLDIDTDEFYPGDNTDIINFHSTGYAYPVGETEVSCPKFMAFMDSVFGDKSLIAVNQEMYGATLMYGRALEKIFLQYGLGRNGKGVLDHVLTVMHGVDCVSTASVAQLSSRFGGAMIYDKVINISTENDMNFVVDTALLKAVSGNDFITIDQKYEKAFQAKVSCKLIISTNEIVFRDRSRGFEERLIPIPFEYTFVDNPKGPKERKKMPNLEADLLEEIPAIFLWAYEGLKRLRANNWQFTQCDKVDKLREEILKDANPVALFFEDRIQRTEGAKVKRSDVYACFENWAFKKRINVGGIVSAHKFYAEFGRVLEQQGMTGKTSSIHGVPYYKGISLIQ